MAIVNANHIIIASMDWYVTRYSVCVKVIEVMALAVRLSSTVYQQGRV